MIAMRGGGGEKKQITIEIRHHKDHESTCRRFTLLQLSRN